MAPHDLMRTFIFAVPVVLIRLFLQPYFPAYADWADFCYMLVFFIFGYIMFAGGRLTQAIRRDGKSALFLGLMATAIMIVALAAGGDREWVENPTMPGFYLAWGLASINGWCWTIFALFFGMTYLSSSSRWLNYGQRAIVPFFLLHQPVIVMIAIPFAFVGVVIGHLLFGMSLSLPSIMGYASLSGIVVNDSIILVDAINQFRREGLKLREAIVSAGQRRIRPIVMTSLTTILALFPLTLGFGESASLRSPMAWAVIGGLVSSTMLTLIVIPCIYMAFGQLGEKQPNKEVSERE